MAQMTSVEWLISNLPLRYKNAIINDCKEEIQQAKQMEEEQKYETSAFWFGRGVLAGKENRIEELKPIKE